MLTIIFVSVFGAVALVLTIYAVKIYNFLVSLKNNVSKSWSNIDVLLKQRHDEIPKLVDVCNGYMKYEKSTLEAVVNARSAAFNSSGINEKAKSEDALSSALGKLFALSEKYPDLKANDSFNQLRNRISQIENQIADRREFYNDSVNNYNVRIQQIPDMFVASFLQYRPQELFKVSAEDKQDVKIQFNLP